MGSSSSTSSNPAMSGSSSMISNDVKNKSKEDLVNAKVEYSTLPCDVVDQSTTLHVSIGNNAFRKKDQFILAVFLLSYTLKLQVEYSFLKIQLILDLKPSIYLFFPIIVKDVIDQHYRQRIQTDDHMSVYIEEEWSNIGKLDFRFDRMSDVLISIGSGEPKFDYGFIFILFFMPNIESMLVQERGIWGPYNESRLTKWNLDMTEGPCRMRKKFVRNPMFYLQYPYQKRRHSSSAGKIN